MSKITPVILSGGSGSRLWPSSRSQYPKQFLKLVGNATMLQETLMRLDGLDDLGHPIFIANEDHRFLVAEQVKAIRNGHSKIILESAPRNTAPAIALASLALEGENEDIILVLPSDHVIEDRDQFHKAIDSARIMAEQGYLITFSIVPDRPETGYGYIKSGNKTSQKGIYEIRQFVEKPNMKEAAEYVASGDYGWNSGMFMFKASAFLAELESYQAEVVRQCRLAMDTASEDLDFLRVGSQAFNKCSSISIDYAVMENTNKGLVLPVNIGWNDVGSWFNLWQQLVKDSNGNVLRGDVIADGANNNLIMSDKKLIAVLGVDNVVLVETDNSILLASMNEAQNVKSIVEKLALDERSEVTMHRKVYRPWGFYDSIENGEGFQVKRLVVYPKAKLSLQMHHHRAEHWVVVKGTAEVVNGDKSLVLHVNESTYIPIGAKHQLANPGDDNLELIEVQSGSYLGEDDIVRFEDIYGRVE